MSVCVRACTCACVLRGSRDGKLCRGMRATEVGWDKSGVECPKAPRPQATKKRIQTGRGSRTSPQRDTREGKSKHKDLRI